MSNWYCIRTATRQEHKVVDGLRDLAALRDIPLDVYLPCETRWNRLARIKVPKDVPMLPGYLFLNIEAEHLWRVDQVEGVYQILGWSRTQTFKEAMAIAAFVGELRSAQEAGAFDHTQAQETKRLGYVPGEKVRVSGGQFSGFIGEIMELRANGRVRVLLQLFGRASPTLIPQNQLEAQDAVSGKAA